MKKLSFLLTFLATFLFCSLSHASINGVGFDQGNGGVNCYYLYDTSAPDVINVEGSQNGTEGLMTGWVTTDTPADPTLTLNNSIDNSGSFAWTSYIVDVFMNVNFSFSGISVANPLNWAGGVSIAVHQVAPFVQQWTGEIVYYANGGPPVNTIPLDPNNTLDFTYKVTFSGLQNYSIQEQVTPVPEPATLSLLFGGILVAGLGLLRRRQIV
jgi:hypothetical protein